MKVNAALLLFCISVPLFPNLLLVTLPLSDVSIMKLSLLTLSISAVLLFSLPQFPPLLSAPLFLTSLFLLPLSFFLASPIFLFATVALPLPLCAAQFFFISLPLFAAAALLFLLAALFSGCRCRAEHRPLFRFLRFYDNRSLRPNAAPVR